MECAKLQTCPNSDVNNKYYIAAAGIGTLIVAYGVYRIYYRYVKEDNYFTKVQWRGGAIQRRILVLGLPGSGKTRLLQCFDRRSKPWVLLPAPSPSFGVNVKSAGMSGIDYHFWDVCHEEQGHNWRGLVRNMDVLVWMVDSTAVDQLGASHEALHACVATVDQLEREREAKQCGDVKNSYGIPIVIVASKQDCSGAMKTGAIFKALEADKFRKKHKAYIVGVQIPNLGHRAGLWRLFELISWTNRKRYM